MDFHPELPLLAVGTGDYDGGYYFEGELLLFDLETGKTVSILEGSREVRRVRWRDARLLEATLAPQDDFDDEDAHSYGFLAFFARDDWTTATDGMISPTDQADLKVDTRSPDPDQCVTSLGAGDYEFWGTRWSPRRSIWALQSWSDRRVLAALEGTTLECWLPSGERAWSIPGNGGGRQIVVSPDEDSAWVVPDAPQRWVAGEGWRRQPRAVERISLENGVPITEFAPGHPVVAASTVDGWVALRDSDHSSRGAGPDTQLISPEGDLVAEVRLGGYDLFNHWFDIRYAPEFYFLRGDSDTEPHLEKWIVAIDPREGAHPRVRRLFPLEWDTRRDKHLFGGPGLYVRDDIGTAIVHAGQVHDGRGLLPGNTFVVRRRLPDGEAEWVFAADVPITALELVEDLILAGLGSGEIVALDSADGSVRWRQTLRLGVHRIAVEPLSLAYTGYRVMIGTFDGRILDCSLRSRMATGEVVTAPDPDLPASYWAEMQANTQWWQERFEPLLDSLRDRLDAHGRRLDQDVTRSIEELWEHAGAELAVDTLAASLANGQIPITPTERDLLHELMYKVENPNPLFSYLVRRDEVMAALHVADDTGR
ncbi:hypothetical protein [Nocardia arthritidis]|uniref:PQQ-binding-like beta-propeller repeat protein n=1 Tax=Nocardia arthritidis TaxID=228602 RepID=A0A6G9YHL0_9NOCA|nr:hypothetical protein [Nocardia arthritidis]QIS12688.1 hypothetical protein F5544_24155 [Nocardia arthritidis]